MITSLMLMLCVDTMPRHCALLTLNMGARSASADHILEIASILLIDKYCDIYTIRGCASGRILTYIKRITMWHIPKRGRVLLLLLCFLCAFQLNRLWVSLCHVIPNKMHIIIYKLPENARCGFQKVYEHSPTTSHKSILL